MSTFAANLARPVTGLRDARGAELAVKIVALVLAVVLIIGALSTQGFLTSANFKAILAAAGFVGIVALGMTAIMISGNLFSLSLGTTVAVGAMLFLWALQWGVLPAILLTIALCAIICALQGTIVGSIGANPIIVTIGAGALQAGAAVWLSDGSSIFPGAEAGDFAFLSDPIGGVAVPVFVLVALVILGELMLRRTRFGREMFLVGENRMAATAAAMRVPWVITGAFAIAGVCAGIAGILLGAFNQNATLLVQGTYTYDAIAAALVGGSVVTGGRGSFIRTLLGALVIAAISDMLLLRGYSEGVQIMVKGIVVIVVVVFVQVTAQKDRQ
jgi:ribose/xylose/arabinose/galactoside ABC-type transport system permease subunit